MVVYVMTKPRNRLVSRIAPMQASVDLLVIREVRIVVYILRYDSLVGRGVGCILKKKGIGVRKNCEGDALWV